MSVDTYIQQARTRVQSEQEAVGEKQDAFDAFVRQIQELSAELSPASSTGVTTVGGVRQRGTSTSERGCRKVRNAFAETIRSHSVANTDSEESLLETIRAEFTETIAVALAPTTEASLTPELKEMVVAEAQTRRAETETLDRALKREARHLDEADEAVGTVIDWIVDRDETPLTGLGFDALKFRHEQLSSHRTLCENIAQQRQAFLKQTTSNGFKAGIWHRQLVPYLYGNFPVDHPVLSTIAQLDETCTECQRNVRDHLVRRA